MRRRGGWEGGYGGVCGRVSTPLVRSLPTLARSSGAFHESDEEQMKMPTLHERWLVMPATAVNLTESAWFNLWRPALRRTLQSYKL